MKNDQPRVAAEYRPSSLWQGILDRAYAPLADAARADDLAGFHFFLANFGAWKDYLAIESSTLIQEYARSPLKRRYLQEVVFGRQLSMWQWFHGGQTSLSRLSYPTFGNQSGAFIDGVFVGPGSFDNEIYGSLLKGIVDGQTRPTIAELGAGYGKLAYFFLRDLSAFTYVDFDLPEVLSVAAYYLIRSFPERRALLYGEAPYTPDVHVDHELVFMPSWEIERLGADSVDLFVNKNSLGEMTRASAVRYVNVICGSTRYFFHINHEWMRNLFGGNESSLLASEYPVPPERFALLVRYPDFGHLFWRGYLDFKSDIFFYLYGRRSGGQA